MLIADLGRFTHLARTAEVGAVERVLETLEVLVNSAARKHDGTIRFNNGDAYFLTFPEPSLAVTAAEAPRRVGGRARRRPVRLKHSLAVASWHHQRISVVPLGRGVSRESSRVMVTSKQCLTKEESGLFITAPVRDALADGPWHKRLRSVGSLQAPGAELYRLDAAGCRCC